LLNCCQFLPDDLTSGRRDGGHELFRGRCW